jgi:gamma-glutamyl hercynylcysteine S-oxide synthase
MAMAHSETPPEVLTEWVKDARRRTLDLINDLDDNQLMGPPLPTLNPLLWEIGHVAWFQEKWLLRQAKGRRPLLSAADSLYDSSAVSHDTRWQLPLPSRDGTLAYMAQVEEQALEILDRPPRPDDVYFALLAIFHEDMHTEAFTYARQTLGYPPPSIFKGPVAVPGDEGKPLNGDAFVSGGVFELGADSNEPFVFDNEKWTHPVQVNTFKIARTPVTQAEFAAFVEDQGYHRRNLWTEAGWAWRERTAAQMPVYWQRGEGGWLRRDFDRWLSLEPNRPVIHVNWFEADAYCRWAGRRLPTEAEWEMTASLPEQGGQKQRFPWGDSSPKPELANLDGNAGGCVDVAFLPAGDSSVGCRQMIGNVWEWTADAFLPYPGFVPDPYKEYSAPWFGDHKVLRGGCWATRGRLLRNSWRNFYLPDRRDVFAGFRTCALSP